MFLFPFAIFFGFRANQVTKKFTISERSDTAAKFLSSSYGCDILKTKGKCHQCFLVNVSFNINSLQNSFQIDIHS